jgi:hypothetical protein
MLEFKQEDKKWISIHPALDFTEEHAYIGQKLRYQDQALFHIISDQGFVIPIQPEENLTHLNLELTHPPYPYSMPRWTNESINRFSRLKRFPTQEKIALDKIQLLSKIKQQLERHLEFSDQRNHTFFALWVAGTYCFPLFNTYPYVHLTGLMQSGKTKLLSLCSNLSFNAFQTANITPACLFRLIEESRSTLFIDEAETLSDRKNSEEIRSILLSGYKKGELAFRAQKSLNGDFEPRGYEVYSPKMIANIEGLEAVLSSRCITIHMQRGTNETIINREIDVDDNVWQEIRDDIYPFIMVNWKEIRKQYFEFQNDTGLTGRELELWKPILCLAKLFADDVFKEMKAFAVEKSAEKNKNLASDEEILIETLLSIVDTPSYFSLKKITENMARRLDFGYVHPRKVAGLMCALGFNKTRRVASGTEFWLDIEKVKEVAKKFGASAVSADSVGVPGQGLTSNVVDGETEGTEIV